MAPHHSTHSLRSNFEGALETMACDATNGVCTTVCGMAKWLRVLGSRRQRKVLAVGCIESYRKCWFVNSILDEANYPNYVILSARMGRLRKPPHRNIGVCCVALRSCGGAFTVNWICLKDLISGYDCLYIHIQYETTGCIALQKMSAWQFVWCCAAEHVAAASV
jgi:hypothetical protein